VPRIQPYFSLIPCGVGQAAAGRKIEHARRAGDGKAAAAGADIPANDEVAPIPVPVIEWSHSSLVEIQ
jgi:hypothetical protein